MVDPGTGADNGEEISTRMLLSAHQYLKGLSEGSIDDNTASPTIIGLKLDNIQPINQISQAAGDFLIRNVVTGIREFTEEYIHTNFGDNSKAYYSLHHKGAGYINLLLDPVVKNPNGTLRFITNEEMNEFYTTLKKQIETMLEKINNSDVTTYFKDFSPNPDQYNNVKVSDLSHPVRKHEKGLLGYLDQENYVDQEWKTLVNHREYQRELTDLVLGKLLRFFRSKDESILDERVSKAFNS